MKKHPLTRLRYRERNSFRNCDWCKKPRGKTSASFCYRCKRRAQRNGHPGQEWLPVSHLRHYRRAAKSFLLEHRAHAGIPEAILRLDALCHRYGLSIHNITGKTVLPRILAVAFIDQQQPTRFRSHDAYRWALAKALMGGWRRVPSRGKIPPKKLRTCGQEILDSIGPLLLNASRAFVAQPNGQDSTSESPYSQITQPTLENDIMTDNPKQTPDPVVPVKPRRVAVPPPPIIETPHHLKDLQVLRDNTGIKRTES